MLGAQQASRLLYPRFGPRRVMLGGLAGVAVFMFLMSTVNFSTNLWVVRAFMFCMGFCMAHCFVPTQAAAFATITGPRTGRASTIFNAQRQLGSAIGVAVLSSVIAAVGATATTGGQLAPNLNAYHAAFRVAAVLMLLAAAVTTTIVDADAAATFRGRRKGAHEAETQGQHAGVPALVSD
jgi:MFS family permease